MICIKNKVNIEDLNIQRYAFQMTINNPKDHGYESNTDIIEKAEKGLRTLTYIAVADEIGKEGTYHTHAYIVCSSRVRFSTIKKLFPDAHIEEAKGSAQSNLDYLRKTGKWKDTEKAETSVPGTFKEWGTFPKQRGTKKDLEELYRLVEAGYSNSEIIAINNDYILHLTEIDRLRTTLLIEKYRGTRRTNLRVIYIYGATGTGKTRSILDTHGDGSVYRVTDYDHPFDSYHPTEEGGVICFDEFRSQLKISDMLNYCDIYPIDLKARYANKYACYETVYIVSNWALEDQYKEVQEKHPDTWNAFLRRIHEVRVFHKDGSVDIYNSVQDYMNRLQEFQSIDDAPEYIQQQMDWT